MIKTNLGTKTKLIIGFSFFITAVFILIVVTYTNTSKINLKHSQITQFYNISRNLTQLRSDQNRLSVLTLEMLLATSHEEQLKVAENMKARIASLTARVAIIDSSLNYFPEEEKMFSEFGENLNQIIENRLQMLKQFESGGISAIAAYDYKSQTELYETVRIAILKLEENLDNTIRQLQDEGVSIENTTKNVNIIFGAGLASLSLFFMLLMLRMVKKVAGEIKAGINVLGISAAEILSTVTEISTGAAETATAVSETTTTIEEIHQTSMVSNQKAQALLLSSQKASESVEDGRDSINSVIESMKKIDHQMELISVTILKLSEQNRSIGEITSSVADIADQSNLLAVNAAIEAAKAGEHGRGFAVVAQEIRSLADQSKKATFQVKDILNEINKSVNHAVGVTDQGSKTVEEGKMLVKQSGEVIEILSENVEETSRASVQISASNQQQMAGIEQIVPAMNNIKQASEQNINGIKQAQSAAHDLNQLGQNLKTIVDKYKL